ncbi:MAG: glycosyltransferase [Chitinophagales bacterium]|nr:glycosyltransferase [Bacteroidota bacterium]MCB9044016.1 glycosyltransferase [Chitinophagales bacterium]
MPKKIHIISFDVPFPPDYGGVVDVFYKIKALYAAGVQVYLHCFHHGRDFYQEELQKYCTQVFFYPRKPLWQVINTQLPLMVQARRSKELLYNLAQEPAFVLMEGLHTTFYLENEKLGEMPQAVRLHNIEWDYYQKLAQTETDFIKKNYLRYESKRLQTYEKRLAATDYLFPLSAIDQAYYQEKFPDKKVIFLPVFHKYNQITTKIGSGNFVLYHGNLSVAENEATAVFLSDVWSEKASLPLVIAGKNPSKRLQQLCAEKNIRLVANPTENELGELLANAHAHILWASQQSGVKLKLLHALFAGRFVLANSLMLAGSHLQDICVQVETKNEIIQKINELATQSFDETMLAQREKVLNQHYNNQKNIEILRSLL